MSRLRHKIGRYPSVPIHHTKCQFLSFSYISADRHLPTQATETKRTLKDSLTCTLSAKTSVITRSNVERIFIASWGSIRPSLIRSSSVSVRDKPMLSENSCSQPCASKDKRYSSPWNQICDIPAPTVELIVRLRAHGDGADGQDRGGGEVLGCWSSCLGRNGPRR